LTDFEWKVKNVAQNEQKSLLQNSDVKVDFLSWAKIDGLLRMG
jgi:hypothetical protein